MKLIQDLGMQFATEKSKHKTRYGIYECPICLKHYRACTTSVKRGAITKCRSCSNRLINIKHGDGRTKIYGVWNNMIRRTTLKTNKSYEVYGARGIIVCDEWLKYENFREWAFASGYKEGITLDRIDVNGNYEPSNCRWADRAVQARNTQRLKKSNTSGYRGVNIRTMKNGKIKFRCRIVVNKKIISLGHFDCRLAAAYAYDEYVINNNLEHTKNFEN